MKETEWSLLARYLSGECSSEEEGEVSAWLAESKENEGLLKMMRTVWSASEADGPTSDIDKLWRVVAARSGIDTAGKTEDPDRKLSWANAIHADNYRFLRIAVAVLFVFGLAYGLSQLVSTFRGTQMTTIAVENGDRETVQLDDGTRIVLDAGSTLRFPARFSQEDREVHLNGEAFFEVASDPEKPFIIEANHARVRVLGTKFNVRAWRPEDNVTVVVSEGSVLLRSVEDESTGSVVLEGGQLSSLPVNGQPSAPLAVDASQYTSWMHNEITFEDTPLRQIFQQLERWYDVEFVVEDSAMTDERMTMHIEGSSLADVLALLRVLTGLDFQHRGDVVKVASNPR